VSFRERMHDRRERREERRREQHEPPDEEQAGTLSADGSPCRGWPEPEELAALQDERERDDWRGSE
jgi:hypothetical protein